MSLLAGLVLTGGAVGLRGAAVVGLDDTRLRFALISGVLFLFFWIPLEGVADFARLLVGVIGTGRTANLAPVPFLIGEGFGNFLATGTDGLTIFFAAAGAALGDFLDAGFAGFLPESLAAAGAFLGRLFRAATSLVFITVFFAVTFSALPEADGVSVFFGASAFFGTVVLDLSGGISVFFVATFLDLTVDLTGEGDVFFFFEITFLVPSAGTGAFDCTFSTLTRFDGLGVGSGLSSFVFRFLSDILAESFTFFFASSFTFFFACSDLRKVVLCSEMSLLGVVRTRALLSNFLATITRFRFSCQLRTNLCPLAVQLMVGA
jgi:hypothetical protein